MISIVPVFNPLSLGEHKTDEFKKINPVGKLPALDDSGFFLVCIVYLWAYLVF